MFLLRPGFRYTFWMRTAGYLRGRPFLHVPYWIACLHVHRLGIKYGISIPHTIQIGPGLFIGHFGGIVVNDVVSIGCNCNLSRGVTIGQRNRGVYKGCPNIGDYVCIGAGACILGAIPVGSHATIGAHAVVVRDVRDNEVVVGNPARVVSTRGSRDYVNWVLDDKDHREVGRSDYECQGTQ